MGMWFEMVYGFLLLNNKNQLECFGPIMRAFVMETVWGEVNGKTNMTLRWEQSGPGEFEHLSS